MPRYKITIEYDGSPFVGWQRQDNGLSVQECLETAIRNLCGERVNVYGAGRTDAGVHALGQVAHFDLCKPYPIDTVRDAVNFHLKPQPIAVLNVEVADADFHARFDGRQRRYLYRILARRAPPTLEAGRVWHVPVSLDHEAMHAAAQVLVGRHDFSTFRAAQCQAKSPVKTLSALAVARYGCELHLSARAPSFLHHQVRSMAGSLKLVGEGKWRARDLRAALDACDRSRCGPVAPAQGLYLVGADYDPPSNDQMA